MSKQNQKINKGWHLTHSYQDLPKMFYTKMRLNPVSAPKLAVLNESLAQDLGLDPGQLKSPEGVQLLAGNQVPPGGQPLAQAYAGHQFGHFTMLGDGRALLLGEQITSDGRRVDVQLKGSGPTPYSRGGDGRAAILPMLREYIISEAMYGLGIPTTRSLAVVYTGDSVHREVTLPGAVLTRIADSHLRVGTFQYAARWGEARDLQALADYVLERHFPEKAEEKEPYLALLSAVVERQASLIAKWQLVGFIHGVMNTDNMTISGETIDYGPCAFMDTYDPKIVFSSIDRHGRYAYGNQPSMASWNLARFAETLLPLLAPTQEEAVEKAQMAITDFGLQFHQYWQAGMLAKLGIFSADHEKVQSLIDELLHLMLTFGADYTNTFRSLTREAPEETAMALSSDFTRWYSLWQTCLTEQRESKEEALALMKANNPAVIPRNHRVEEALEAASVQQDTRVMNALLAVLADPYAYSPEQERYAGLPDSSCSPYRTFCGT